MVTLCLFEPPPTLRPRANLSRLLQSSRLSNYQYPTPVVSVAKRKESQTLVLGWFCVRRLSQPSAIQFEKSVQPPLGLRHFLTISLWLALTMSQCFISALPDEILSSIMITSDLLDRKTGDYRFSSTSIAKLSRMPRHWRTNLVYPAKWKYTLLLISKHWRLVAISTPQLWNQILLDLRDPLQKLLRQWQLLMARTGNIPLHISIACMTESPFGTQKHITYESYSMKDAYKDAVTRRGTLSSTDTPSMKPSSMRHVARREGKASSWPMTPGMRAEVILLHIANNASRISTLSFSATQTGYYLLDRWRGILSSVNHICLEPILSDAELLAKHPPPTIPISFLRQIQSPSVRLEILGNAPWPAHDSLVLPLNIARLTITAWSAMPPDCEQWAIRDLNAAVAFFNCLSFLENMTLFCTVFKYMSPSPTRPLKPLPRLCHLALKSSNAVGLLASVLLAAEQTSFPALKSFTFIHDARGEEQLMACINTCCKTIIAGHTPVLEYLTFGSKWCPPDSRVIDSPAAFMPWGEDVLLSFPICLRSIELRGMNLRWFLTALVERGESPRFSDLVLVRCWGYQSEIIQQLVAVSHGRVTVREK